MTNFIIYEEDKKIEDQNIKDQIIEMANQINQDKQDPFIAYTIHTYNDLCFVRADTSNIGLTITYASINSTTTWSLSICRYNIDTESKIDTYMGEIYEAEDKEDCLRMYHILTDKINYHNNKNNKQNNHICNCKK